MGKRVRRVPVQLDAGDISGLPFDEIKAILRGTDDLIMRGGRNLLAKILKGSRDKKIFDLNLDRNPVYGYFHHLTIKEITQKIDWVIIDGYLTIEYDYRLPLLVYKPKGWKIEMDTYSDELLQGFDDMLEGGTKHFLMIYLKDKNRELIWMLLDKVETTGDSKYIPLLESWKKVDYRKVRQRINRVIDSLKGEFGG
ncbi:MAG: RQC-minor-1 family DNA-binding protein [Thermodesulfobacteriota bacterium]|nr:RQC-minor-1 family DNA-binding protein [Thermodesulfobacteriota bacterium]